MTTGIRQGRHSLIIRTISCAALVSDKLPDKLQVKITSEALLADLNYIQTIEFMDSSPRFWGIAFPSEDWNPAEQTLPTPTLLTIPSWRWPLHR